MNDPEETLRLRDAKRIDALCGEFESAWNSGNEPDIDGFLSRVPEELRDALFAELLATDWHIRKSRGEEVTFRHYSEQFPLYEAAIARFVNVMRDRQKGSANQSLEGSRVRHYELRERIGVGGMGVVYRAYDSKADREVALKLIGRGDLEGDKQVQRFREEAKAAAQMQHPNIVPLFEVGHEEGREFYTMALIEGGDLKKLIHDRSLEPRAVAAMFLKLARALEYAHAQGVIHRDIKPSNILLHGEQTPMLADFGIAKRLDEDSGNTETGQMMGTLAYMAPEQHRDAKHVGPQADIYGLGASMYESLTGRPPFIGDDQVQLLSDIQHRDPASPSEVRDDVDSDLAKICLRCLQKEPGDRYPSARKLAGELEKYLAGEPLGLTEISLLRASLRLLGYRQKLDEIRTRAGAWVIAGVSAIVHPTIFLLTYFEQSHVALWFTVGLWVVAACLSNFLISFRKYWQLAPVERSNSVIFLSVNIAHLCILAMYCPLSFNEPIDKILSIYPPFSLVAGVATFAHAGFFSGRWMLYGLVFFAVALLSHWLPVWSPLFMAATGTVIALMVAHDVYATR